MGFMKCLWDNKDLPNEGWQSEKFVKRFACRGETYPDGWQGEMGSLRVQPVDLAERKSFG